MWLIVKIAIPVIVVILTYYFVIDYKRYKYILGITISKISRIRGGPSAIEGRVVALDEVIKSPLTDSDCVYYKFMVGEEQAAGGDEYSTTTYYKTIIDATSYCKFGMDDGSEIAILENLGTAEVTCSYNYRREESGGGSGKKADTRQKKVLEKYGRSHKGWIFEKSLQYTEHCLKPGDKIYVVGEAKYFDGNKPVFRSGIAPLYIFDKSKDEVIMDYKKKILIFAISAIVLFVAEIYLLLKIP